MIKRDIVNVIEKYINLFPVILITGARQVGKSTICKYIADKFNYSYVSLDNIDNRSQAHNDPKFFLNSYNWPLIIDEVQYVPTLFNYIQTIVNEKRINNEKVNGLFILTESQNYHLMNGITESLAGRVGIINMNTLSFNETINRENIPFSFNIDVIKERIINNYGPNDLFSTIIKGFYPELYNNPNLSSYDFYSNYVSSYIDRDVSNLINLKDKFQFHRFMQLIASLTGQEIIYDNIANALDLDKKTIMNWISVLEASNIVYLLEPYYENSLVNKVIKRHKLYFTDIGLCSYLAQIYDKNVLMNSIYKGHFVENYVINEIIKSYLNAKIPANFSFYRDNLGNEIDLIINNDGKLTLIEIKSGTTYTIKDIKGFNALNKTNYQIVNSGIIALVDNVYKLAENRYVIPISSI